MTTLECVFCQKLAEWQATSSQEVLWDFPQSVVILGNWQYYHGYCLLIGRRHATELTQLSQEERGAFMEELCLVARAIEDCFRPLKLNYELLGNQVPHLHWHLFPRYREDPQVLKPVWLDLDRAESDPATRKRLQQGPLDRETTMRLLREKLQILSRPA